MCCICIPDTDSPCPFNLHIPDEPNQRRHRKPRSAKSRWMRHLVGVRHFSKAPIHETRQGSLTWLLCCTVQAHSHELTYSRDWHERRSHRWCVCLCTMVLGGSRACSSKVKPSYSCVRYKSSGDIKYFPRARLGVNRYIVIPTLVDHDARHWAGGARGDGRVADIRLREWDVGLRLQ